MSSDRGRVPFAVVGVLLLVSGATLTATSRTRVPATTEPAVDRAVERASAATVTALRRATLEAARESASSPVVWRADTPAGRGLRAQRPFRDALDLRTSLSLRRRLQTVEVGVEDVTVTARLPALPANETSAVRAAVERATVEPAGPNGTALRSRVRNVTLVVRRNGRVVDRVRRTPVVVVGTPVLALHERMERFDRRVDAGPLDPGFGRRLTARLYAVAWTRGAAQYGGAPIANVLGTRHVELQSNAALRRVQRATLGGADPDLRPALSRATARVGVVDATAGAQGSLGRVTSGGPGPAPPPGPTWAEVAPAATGPTAERNVSVGRVADLALARLVEDRTGRLRTVLQRAYTASTRTDVATERLGRRATGGGSPGPGWTLVSEQPETRWSVTPLDGDGPVVETDPGWHRLARAERHVVRHREVVRTWRRAGRVRRTVRVERTSYAVTAVLGGRARRAPGLPGRPVATVFDPTGSPVGGPNLADAGRRARGRFDARAERVVTAAVGEGVTTRTAAVAGTHPDAVRTRALADLASLHRRVENVSVPTERGALATLETNPPARLAAELRDRRADLVDAPETHGSVASRARVAARAAYVDAVIERLERRAADHRRTEGALDETLRSAGAGSLDRLRAIQAAVGPVDLAEQSSAPPRGFAGPLVTEVDTAPAYLSTTAVRRREVGLQGRGRFRPLATRNLNLFTVPFADAADTVVGALFDDRRVRLRTAARTLQTARRVDAATRGGGSGATDRTALRRDVERSVGVVRDRLDGTLARRGLAEGSRERALALAFEQWERPTGRAIALSNGSATRALVDVVVRRHPRFREPGRRIRLRAALDATVARALRSDAVRPRREPTNATLQDVRRVAREVSREVASRGLERGVETARHRLRGPLSEVPAGLPVTPVPGSWYATTNVWVVEVRGRYERVVLRARRGRPPTGTLAYVRDGGVVRLDVDGDGTPERLGRSSRVGFTVETVIAVAVPPGGSGVGDTDGNADERSAGWPGPGPPDERPDRGARGNETTYGAGS